MRRIQLTATSQNRHPPPSTRNDVIACLCISLCGPHRHTLLRLGPLYLNYMKVASQLDATASESQRSNPTGRDPAFRSRSIGRLKDHDGRLGGKRWKSSKNERTASPCT